MVLFPASLWQTGALSRQAAIESLRDNGAETLTLFINNLQSELEKYKFLPKVLARNQAIVRLLGDPQNDVWQTQVNAQLEEINNAVKASDTYVMDADGLTLAASNWRSTRPFVGKNFSFRPYFQAAMRGESGGYAALGSTSNKRGYYFAQPIRGGGGILGAAVVKVSLERIEAAWRRAPERIIVTDYNGVVFISNNPDWHFRLLRPLPADLLEQIRKSRQYGETVLSPLPIVGDESEENGVTLFSVAQLSARDESNMLQPDAPGTTYLAQTAELPEHGWIVHVLSNADVVDRQVALAVSFTSVVFLALVLVVVYLTQRRNNLQQRLAHQAEVEETLRRARSELEIRVEERTVDLKSANQQLQQEVGERKRAEEDLRLAQDELVQAAKLAALGQLSAGITHELNQPLSAIRSFADNAQVLLERARYAEASENLETIAELTERMGQITRQLKTFARKTQDTVTPASLGEAVHQALALMCPRARRDDIAILNSVPHSGLQVMGNPVRLEQVVVNLVSNAIDAITDAEHREVHISTEVQGDFIELTIRDTGTGMTDTALPQVFDPFFTTKEIGEGLGLGLSISYGIVQKFGGTMRAENYADGGAAFTVRLLRAQSDSENAA